MKNNKAYGNIKGGILRWLAQQPLLAVLSHWAFQSLFYMGWTERAYKISIDILLTIIAYSGLQWFLPWQIALITGFVLAHTVNFLFNGQLWAALKCFGLVKMSNKSFFAYVQSLVERARREPSIRSLIVYGSLARGEKTDTSDLDARLLRQAGFMNALRACTFLLLERSRALFAHFPLDMYLVDNPKALKKLRSDEQGKDLLADPLPERLIFG